MAARDGAVQRKGLVLNREQSRHQLGLVYEARSGPRDFLETFEFIVYVYITICKYVEYL